MNHHSTAKIIAKNTFTLFNIVNLILALMVASVGSYKNMLFILIAIANTLISIINELRAKHITDRLKLLSEQNPTVIRNGKPYQVKPAEVIKGDLTVLGLGDQIMYDSIIREGTIEVNESFITGEQDNIMKHPGDLLTSGSFVVSGTAKAEVEHIGTDNFVTKLQNEATTIKTADSKLFKLMNNIVKYISYTLIPIGALLLWSRFRTEADATSAVTSTVAALINMIPEGLILLTSSVLALATIRLSRKKVLVQDLYAIETLARVDTICLDKTGTLTTGNMTVKDTVPATRNTSAALENTLNLIMTYLPVDNATSHALAAKFAPKHSKASLKSPAEIIPFSSDRKYSGVRVGDTEYLIGATEFLTDDAAILQQAKALKGVYRLLAVVRRKQERCSEESVGGCCRDRRSGAPVKTGGDDSVSEEYRSACAGVNDAELLGFVRLEDEIRPTAPKIIQYFYNNDISIKIISGDDLATVATIAKQVGAKELKGVDLSTLARPSYVKLVKEYDIFTRVKPSQKKELIKALKKQGRTVAMTGDGVNDILAMKEADCSLAIGAGSDAARRAAKFVLLNSGFEAVPSIIDEGRQSINNLERSTALFLTKTVYASILAVVFVILPFSYPFSPIEMSLLNFACIGLPGLILALEKNTARIKDRFLSNILEYSIPIGFTVSAAMLALSIISHFNHFSRFELTTTSLFITFAIDLILIYWISRPLNLLRTILIFTIVGIMAAAFFIPFAREFFEFTFLTQNGIIIMVAIIAVSVLAFNLMRFFAAKLSARLRRSLHI
ncbi:HAD-IC family P-type ATPase [Candidatus Saccharibacteria bacterium]|nr:HAD-IC family P-type ATPase [Candidatus Saccharibacteria bacterium]